MSGKSVNISFGAVLLRENMTYGQVIAAYEVEYLNTTGAWVGVPFLDARSITIGNHRIQPFHNVVATQFRVNITKVRGRKHELVWVKKPRPFIH